MPYWFETKKLRVGKKRDKRIKLTDEDKELIKKLYQEGTPIRKITKIINKVNRRAIQFFLFPDRLKRQYYYKRLRNYDYKRERHTKYIKKYRQHLKEIYGLKKFN